MQEKPIIIRDFISEMLFIREAYEAMTAIYERMSVEDLRIMHKYRPDGWEKELIKSIGLQKSKQQQNERG
jgi:hypothetical protein